jgi:serine/threonine protein kinase
VVPQVSPFKKNKSSALEMAANFISIEQFNIVRVIGKGSFGKVFEALKQFKSYAVKCIKLPEDDAELAHSSLKEINVTKLYEILESILYTDVYS